MTGKRAEELPGMSSLPRNKFVRLKNFSRCAGRRNQVLDGLKSNLFEFIQDSMSEKVSESISCTGFEFEGRYN